MKMLKDIQHRFRTHFRQWVDRRVPRARTVTLDQKRIFIFPSRVGLWFIVVLMVMLLTAINYQINMAFALVFLLGSVFVITILHTYANLSGLAITAVRASPTFAGDQIELELVVSRTNVREYYDVLFSWEDSVNGSVTLKNSSEAQLKLYLPTKSRGKFTPQRLLIETFYPLGLLRAWTWIALEFDALVYPCPIVAKLQSPPQLDSRDGAVKPIVGSDDFYSFKNYNPGDSLKHVLWKTYAKGQSLQTKQYQSYAERRLWLDWEQFVGDIEQRLSQLCYWVLELDKNNDEYGLRLPGLEIQPSSGEQHKTRILKTLALFTLQSEGVE